MIRCIPNPDQVNLHRMNPVWLRAMHVISKALSHRVTVYQTSICERRVQSNCTCTCSLAHKWSFWARSATVSAKRDRTSERERAITCRQRAGSYYTRPENQANDFGLLHLQNSKRRCQNCALRYNFLKAARFVLKQWFVYDCTYLLLCSWDVQCYMLLYATERQSLVLWINNFKSSLKTSVSLVLATKHLKL